VHRETHKSFQHFVTVPGYYRVCLFVNPNVFKRDNAAIFEMSLQIEGIYKSGGYTKDGDSSELTQVSLMKAEQIDVLEKELDDMTKRAETIIADQSYQRVRQRSL
jgi:hypothetical protein